MSKSFLTRKFRMAAPARRVGQTRFAAPPLGWLCVAVSLSFGGAAAPGHGQDAAATDQRADFWTTAKAPVYPRGVTLSGDQMFIVDSDAPGVWAIPWPTQPAGPLEPVRFVTGSRLLRRTLNRPFSAVAHPEQGVLVGDAATREIYHVTRDESSEAGQRAVPLTGGYLGIPMALIVSPDAKTLYIGDAERRAVFSLPLTAPTDGDEDPAAAPQTRTPELVVRVNARGFAWDDQGALLAVTPDADAVQRINVAEKTTQPLVRERPYGFPGGIAWSDGVGFVSDVYGKCIWTFNRDGETEVWFDGDPLVGPVGMTATPTDVLVADPKIRQVVRINRETRQATALLPATEP